MLEGKKSRADETEADRNLREALHARYQASKGMLNKNGVVAGLPDDLQYADLARQQKANIEKQIKDQERQKAEQEARKQAEIEMEKATLGNVLYFNVRKPEGDEMRVRFLRNAKMRVLLSVVSDRVGVPKSLLTCRAKGIDIKPDDTVEKLDIRNNAEIDCTAAEDN